LTALLGALFLVALSLLPVDILSVVQKLPNVKPPEPLRTSA
jgi:hypothetical protein